MAREPLSVRMSPEAVGERRARIEQFRQSRRPRVVPSLLACDFSRLGEEIAALEAAGAEMLQLDVMDGHFVPSLSYGPLVIAWIRQVTALPLDAHLMISNPENCLDDYITAGCDIVTIHIEAVPDPKPLLDQIHNRGRLAGIAINPPTSVERLVAYREAADLVLVMSVMPGYGGQAFDISVIPKLRQVRRLLPETALLSVDGGLNRQTVGRAAEAGAGLLIVGSAIFKSADYGAEIAALTTKALQAAEVASTEKA